jgi:hypothetical protein
MMPPAAPPDHAGREDLRAVDDPPEVDVENSPPRVHGAEHPASRLDARVVHQDVGAAEAVGHRALQRLDRGAVGYVGVERQHLRRTFGPHGFRRRIKQCAPDIDQRHAHAPRPNSRAAARPMPDAPPVTTATESRPSAG